MSGTDLLLDMFALLASPKGVSIKPSLCNLDVRFSDASLIRIDNIDINLRSCLPRPERDDPLPLTIEHSNGERTDLEIAPISAKPGSADAASAGSALGRYRLDPHLIFDDARAAEGEHDIAWNLKVVIVAGTDTAEMTLLSPNHPKQDVHVDPSDGESPVALLNLKGERMDFGEDGQLASGKHLRAHWSLRPLPRGSAFGSPGVGPRHQANPMMITVSREVYDAAWLLTRQDTRGLAPEHYMLLSKRGGELDDVP